jgi:hypothetical protein
MRRYHHYGVPTKAPMPGETYHAEISLHVLSYSKSPYGIEYFRFDPSYKDNPRVKDHPDVISQVPHVAFIVDDLAAEMAGKEVVFGPNTILDDWIVGWIMEGGVLVELIQTSMSDDEIRAMVARSE